MADKKYNLAFELSDGTTKNVQFSVPHVEVGKDVPSYDEHKNLAERIANNDERITSNDERITHNDERIAYQEKRLTNLEKGVAADNFVTDDSVAYVKSVPANAAPYAAISKVGGMTKKCANLFDKHSAGIINCYFTGSAKLVYSPETKVAYIPCRPSTTYTVSKISSARFYVGFCAEVPVAGVAVTNAGGSSSGANVNTKTSPSDASYLVVFMYHSAVDTVSLADVLDSIMINEGETALPYEAYFEGLRNVAVTKVESSVGRTIPIPEAVQALDGYGWGIDGEYNNNVAYEDGRRTWNYRVVKKVFDGTETWIGGGNTGNANAHYIYKIATLGSVIDEKSVCNKADFADVRGATTVVGQRVYNSTSYNSACFSIRPENAASMTTTLMKELVKSWYDAGDPLVVYYVLATPEVTDISDLLSADNLIEVEGGGGITFENEHGLAVPSEVIYQTKGAAV